MVADRVRERAAVGRIRKQRQSDLDARRRLGRLQVFDADEAGAREERRAEDVAGEAPADFREEISGVLRPDVEGEERGRVVGGEHGDVGVHAESGVQVLDRVATVGNLNPELRLVLILELRADRGHLRLDRRIEARVRGRVARRHIVKCENEIQNVFVAGREVPRHRPLLDHDSHRVRTAAEVDRIALPVPHPRVSIRDALLSEQHGIIDLRIPDDGAGRPVGEIGRIERAVNLAERIAGDLVTARIEEERARGITGPREPRRRIDDPGQLEAGVEDVLIRRALGPEAAAADGRARERDADLPDVVHTARLAIGLEQESGGREEIERARPPRPGRRLRGCDRSQPKGRQRQQRAGAHEAIPQS